MNSYPEVVAEFIDKYGEKKFIHKTRRGLHVKRNFQTTVLQLSNPIARMLGENIKKKRIEIGLTLEELCVRAGIKTSMPKARMWAIENAVRNDGIRMGTIYALAIVLGCEVSQILPTVNDVKETAKVVLERSHKLVVKGK